ncbi:MAG: MFS transporter [Chloroflexi bacterium]|nr:MFS transporter [Chloroflexota bacterium]
MAAPLKRSILQQRWEWLTPDLTRLMVSRAIRSLGQGYLGVILPLYMLALGYNAIALGTMFTVSAIVSAALTLLVSVLADLYSRKFFLITFGFLTAIAAMAFATTTSFGLLVLLASVGTLAQNAGAGAAGGGPVYPAQQAFVTEFTKPQSRTVVFSAFSFVAALVTTVGSLLAGVPDLLMSAAHVSRVDSYKPLFVLTAVLAVVSVLVIVPVHEERHPRTGNIRRRLLPTESRGVIGRLALTNMLNGFGVGFFAPFVSYWFHTRYGQGPAQIGILFALVNLGSALPYLVAPVFARWLGVVRAVTAIRLFGVVSLVILPLMPNFLLAAAVYFFRMTLQRASIPLRQSYTMGVVAASERSSAAGLSNLPSQITTAISPSIAGYIFESGSLVIPFEIGSVLQLLNLVFFWGFFRNAPLPEEVGRGSRAREQRSAVTPS